MFCLSWLIYPPCYFGGQGEAGIFLQYFSDMVSSYLHIYKIQLWARFLSHATKRLLSNLENPSLCPQPSRLMTNPSGGLLPRARISSGKSGLVSDVGKGRRPAYRAGFRRPGSPQTWTWASGGQYWRGSPVLWSGWWRRWRGAPWTWAAAPGPLCPLPTAHLTRERRNPVRSLSPRPLERVACGAKRRETLYVDGWMAEKQQI